MQIKKAEFIKSAVKPADFPPAGRPEIAFAGRSNVGKSSLINSLLNRKSLAKTSSKPGCTRTLNFFLVNDSFYFVDLPGYGFARLSVAERASFRPMVERYLQGGRNLRAVVLIIDIRRDPGEEELDFLAWLAQNQIPSIIALTKSDKLSANQRRSRIAAISRGLESEATQLQPFSATAPIGRQEMLTRLKQALNP